MARDPRRRRPDTLTRSRHRVQPLWEGGSRSLHHEHRPHRDLPRPAALGVRAGRSRRAGGLGRGQPGRPRRSRGRRLRGVARPVPAYRRPADRRYLAGRLSGRLLPRRPGARCRRSAASTRPCGTSRASRWAFRSGNCSAGRVRDHIACYGWIGGDRPHEVAEAAAGRRAQGFKAVKMNATAEMGFLAIPRRHSTPCSNASRPCRLRAWRSVWTSTAGCAGRWPSSWSACSSRSGRCSSKSRC